MLKIDAFSSEKRIALSLSSQIITIFHFPLKTLWVRQIGHRLAYISPSILQTAHSAAYFSIDISTPRYYYHT
jgi:hypothetical protein